AVLELRLQHFDLAALGGDFEALRGDVSDAPDFPGHVGEAAEQNLARIENLELPAVESRPGSRRRIASTNQVVDVIDRLGPVDLRFGSAAPALVARLRFVLHDLLVFRRDYQ